ncbi:MAG: hypothetical protein R3E12_00435 [Candidatus Eisenbacteria bacterium]
MADRSLRQEARRGNSCWDSNDVPSVAVGERYVLFLEQVVVRETLFTREPIPERTLLLMSRAVPIGEAEATLLWLQREHGPGRTVSAGGSDVPQVSFLSIVRHLEEGDSLSRIHAARALGQLGDSAGVGIGALVAVPGGDRGYSVSRPLRLAALNALSPVRHDRAARQVVMDLCEDPDPLVAGQALRILER